MEDAMMRASSLPEPVPGKQPHHSADGNDTQSHSDLPLTTLPQLSPSIGNIAAVSLRYATKKKLCPKQRDEVDTFLLVSAPLTCLGACLTIS